MSEKRTLIYNNAREDVPDSKFRHLIEKDGKFYITRWNDNKKLVQMTLEKATRKYTDEVLKFTEDMKSKEVKKPIE